MTRTKALGAMGVAAIAVAAAVVDRGGDIGPRHSTPPLSADISAPRWSRVPPARRPRGASGADARRRFAGVRGHGWRAIAVVRALARDRRDTADRGHRRCDVPVRLARRAVRRVLRGRQAEEGGPARWFRADHLRRGQWSGRDVGSGRHDRLLSRLPHGAREGQGHRGHARAGHEAGHRAPLDAPVAVDHRGRAPRRLLRGDPRVPGGRCERGAAGQPGRRRRPPADAGVGQRDRDRFELAVPSRDDAGDAGTWTSSADS